VTTLDRTQMGWWNEPGALDEDIAALPEHRAGQARAARFCLARLAEEEAMARATAPSGQRYLWKTDVLTDSSERTTGYCVVSTGNVAGVAEAWGLERGTAPAVADHIARQDPAATLARVSALRRMIAYIVSPRPYGEDFSEGEAAASGNMIYLLVDLWPDHPDRDPEWLESE